MSNKKSNRLRRAKKTRARLKLHGKHRLCVYRSAQHIYAQIISPEGDRTIVSASSTEPELRKQLKYGGNVEAAKLVGTQIAERAKNAKIESIGFDRSGHRYHGRVKMLADAAREAGLTI
jgi:large subunit ribosomal protein L18